MKGVLILAHGSRVEATKKTINEVVDLVRGKITDMPIQIAYMEFCEENIEHGIKMLVEKGVTEIKAVPYFLFEGIHIKEDIPNEIGEILQNYPDVKLEMGHTLGADERLADILVDRIRG
ncbi:Sirohydrochlorin cobaltochelatase [uncultured Eubacterium sp.]|uniref:sirohydrochlorin chelatase n=1 Tax=Emergencia sp. TaxID=1926557 RepID=UPI0008232B7E|nr:Sirohydrochlorin cobaltochelatase [uncultured Eubacterium sp.]